MIVTKHSVSRRSLRGVLATASLVGLYLIGTLGVSSIAMTAGSEPALAKAKKKSGGGGGSSNNRGRRGGRGGRGRGCSVVLRVLDVC